MQPYASIRVSINLFLVRLEGFEPSHPVPETGALSPELWAQVSGDPVGIRTLDPQLRRLLLYPAELLSLKKWSG